MEAFKCVFQVVEASIFFVLKQVIAGNLTFHRAVYERVDRIFNIELFDLGVDIDFPLFFTIHFVFFLPEYFRVKFVNPVYDTLAAYGERIDVICELLLRQVGLVVISGLFHEASFADLGRRRFQLVLQLLVSDRLVNILFKREALLCEFAGPSAAPLEQLDTGADEDDPAEVDDEDERDQPEVVREQTELLLLDQADLGRHEPLEQVVLQNRRHSVHQQEARDVEHQDVFEESKCVFREIAIELNRLAIAFEKQAFVHPEVKKKYAAATGYITGRPPEYRKATDRTTSKEE
eukprot:CAMPEP_0170464190 /NCGR_PEP_ID=MMETSP0123-20130129/9014_1 /TAXON_ID=182087 /ORGANISM="Favella ehrenbergii, Strain Fehren 1" /LENGTH=290 /DNA_ID=CAMNT_0010729799 /DNA_START=66 /DNA_END=939 /DNA_ORIENTATION=+